MQRFDVIIVGAGLMGCFTARHLSARNYNVAILERENDVSMGISRSNTAIVYAGYDMKPGTLKAQLTVAGNAAFADLCDELSVAFTRPGSLMLASGPRGQSVLANKLEQGKQSGVPGLRLLDSYEVHELEPGVSIAVTAGLHAPSTGTVNPWQLCLAAAKDALNHGAQFFFEHEVVSIESGYCVRCSNDNSFFAPVVINCSGIDADRISELIAPIEFRFQISTGSYLVLDERDSVIPNRETPPLYPQYILFSEPEEKGKGVTFVPTMDGTLMLGPSEEYLDSADREPGYPAEVSGLNFVRSQSLEVFPELLLECTIRNFGTLRPVIKWAEAGADGSAVISDESIHDFHIAWAKGCPGLLNVAGIKTPGLTCADGIGMYAADMVEKYLHDHLPKSLSKPLSTDTIKTPDPVTRSGREIIPLSNPQGDSEILCRCRQKTYGEVRAAIRSELGARTVDGVKRRVGCGLGRCQGGFCMERVMLVLAEELGCDPIDIKKDRSGSWIATGKRVVREPKLSCQLLPLTESGSELSPEVKESTPSPRQLEKTRLQKSTPSPRQFEKTRLLVVGGGAAGLSAACAATKAGVPPDEILLVDRLNRLGGILPQCSHHGFGERDHGGTLSGPEFLTPLLQEFHDLALPLLLRAMVTSIAPTRTVTLASSAGSCSFKPEVIIFAAGCRERPPGSLPIAGTRPSGIFTAGAAQRMVNLQHWDIGNTVIVLGSGDVGMVMAHTLTEHSKHILALVEQTQDATGLKTNRSRYVDAHDIPLIVGSTITRIFGHRRIEGVEIEEISTGKKCYLDCDTLIVSVGLIPETDLLKELRQPPWLYLAGNARRVHSYIEGVVADGITAGEQAASYLIGQGITVQ